MCYSNGVDELRVQMGDEVIIVEGRTAAMIDWLSERVERLNGQQRLRVEFDCAGNKIKTRFTVFEDAAPITVGPLLRR